MPGTKGGIKEVFMHFLDKRVNVICEELKKLKVKQKFQLDNWKYKEGTYIRDRKSVV